MGHTNKAPRVDLSVQARDVLSGRHKLGAPDLALLVRLINPTDELVSVAEKQVGVTNTSGPDTRDAHELVRLGRAAVDVYEYEEARQLLTSAVENAGADVELGAARRAITAAGEALTSGDVSLAQRLVAEAPQNRRRSHGVCARVRLVGDGFQS